MTQDVMATPPPRYPFVALRELVTINPKSANADRARIAHAAYVTVTALDARNASVSPLACSIGAIPAAALPFQSGDVLLARQLTALQTGKAALAPPLQTAGFCSPALTVIRVDNSRLDPRFLLLFLRPPQIADLVAAFLHDEIGVHPAAPVFLKEMLIALPPLDHQHALIAQVDAMAAQEQDERNALQALHRQRRATIFDGQVRFVRDAPRLAA